MTRQPVRISQANADVAPYRQVFECCTLGIAVVGDDGYPLRCNAALQRMLGYTETELRGMSFRDFTHPDDVATDVHFEELLAGTRPDYQIEKRYVRKNGETFWARLTASLLSHSPVQVMGMIEDTSRIRGLQQDQSRALHQLGERVKELTALHDVGRVFQNDALTVYELLSAVAAALPPSMQFPRSAAARVWHGHHEACTAGFVRSPWSLRTEFKTGDNTPGGVEVVYREPQAAADEGPFLFEECALLASIGEGLRSVLERRHAQERFAVAMEVTGAGTWEWEIPTDTIQWSPQMHRIFGTSGEHAPANYEQFFNFVDPEDRSATALAIQKALVTESGQYAAQFRGALQPDGLTRWVSTHGRVLRDETGRPRRMLGFAFDVSERHSLEDQLRQAQKLEAIGSLAAGVAHDFNNLLSVVISYSEMAMMRLKAADPLREELEQIRHAGERAGVLTRQLLAFSRQQVLQPRPLSLSVIVQGLEKMLRRLVNEDVELVLELARDLGTISADPGQMEQVIVNLVVNARDAMPGGGKLSIATTNVMLDAAYAAEHHESKPGPHVLLSVTDSGVGMTAATQARIFEPFFTTKDTGKGTGLGLSTVFGIVRQSGGHIRVQSEPGQGTTFSIYLPRIEGPAASAPSVMPQRVTLRGTETVLLVEDEAQVRALARIVLERSGYTVLEAQNCGDALLIAEQEDTPIHLLLTDVIMPRMSGPALAQRLQRLRPELKVLFMSGYSGDLIMNHAVLVAGVALLAKPLTPDKLLRHVRDALDGFSISA